MVLNKPLSFNSRAHVDSARNLAWKPLVHFGQIFRQVHIWKVFPLAQHSSFCFHFLHITGNCCSQGIDIGHIAFPLIPLRWSTFNVFCVITSNASITIGAHFLAMTDYLQAQFSYFCQTCVFSRWSWSIASNSSLQASKMASIPCHASSSILQSALKLSHVSCNKCNAPFRCQSKPVASFWPAHQHFIIDQETIERSPCSPLLLSRLPSRCYRQYACVSTIPVPFAVPISSFTWLPLTEQPPQPRKRLRGAIGVELSFPSIDNTHLSVLLRERLLRFLPTVHSNGTIVERSYTNVLDSQSALYL